MTNPTPRALAAHLLLKRDQGSQFTEELLADELNRIRLPPTDRGLFQELTYGVVRWQRTLDWLIQRKTPPGRNQKAALQVLLQLGLYQLFWLDRIPDHAAVHETVGLAKQLGFGHQAGFINAVLRAYLRERQETERLLEDLKVTEPALGYSHPNWLLRRWDQGWGRDSAVRLMASNNQTPITYARANSLRGPIEKLPGIWNDENVTFERVEKDWLPSGLVFELKSHPALLDLPSFREGLFYVQDPSTLLAAHELDPKPGETVLDFCAAPGGKTTYLAQLMENRGRIVACDLEPHRLKRLQENCQRLGVCCAEIARDCGPPQPAGQPGQFDRALVDVPCSNTGVLRRRVDLRWRLRPEEIERLQRTQLQILGQAAGRLRQGGTLVYSTCSLEAEENGRTIEEFLKENAAFRLDRERQLLPFSDQVDGAYVARLVRVEPIP